jgi:tetratricopeptide (TPR) repeat protein
MAPRLPRSGQTTPAVEGLTRGVEHHRAGRLQEAEKAYRRFLSDQPDFAPALHLYGVLLAQTGRAERGAEEIAKAVAAQPANPVYLNDLGNAFMEARRLREAVEAYDRALAAARRDFPQAQFNRANALMRLGELEAALQSYDSALKIGASAPVLTNRGLVLAQLARYDEAIASFQQAVALAPESRDARLNLGLALRKLGRTEEAIAALQELTAAFPDAAEAHVALGGIHHDAGRAAEARAAFERALSGGPTDVDALAGLAAIAHDEGRFEEAEAFLRRVLEMRPSDSTALTNLGLVRQEQDDVLGAADAFSRALAADGRNKRAMAHLAIALQQGGRTDEARVLFDFGRLIAIREVAEVEGFASVDAFNEAVAGYVLGDPTLMLDRPSIATTQGSQTLEILVGDGPERRALRSMIEREVRSYIASVLTASGNPYANQATERWRLTGWAVVLHSGGHQSPHIHPQGFASGVYYVRVPETIRASAEGDAGHIAFGRSKPWGEGAEAQEAFLSRTIKPVEGRMVLFPSHFWHYTVPFESEEPRICVAFDVVPA